MRASFAAFLVLAALAGACSNRDTSAGRVQDDGPRYVLAQRATARMKLLWIVDTTDDAAALREQLAAAMPDAIEALMRGDADLDGARDQAVVTWLRSGIASADVAWPGVIQPDCSYTSFDRPPMIGDEGPGAPCSVSPWVDAAAIDPASIGAAGDTLACIARRATPTACPIRQGGRVASTLLLRESEPEALTVTIAVTLSDDCSPYPAPLGDPERSPILDELVVTRLSCTRYPFETIHPFFGVGRSDQRYLAIAGFPADIHDPLVYATFRETFGLGARSPDVVSSSDDPTRPEPICNGPGGVPVDPAVHWAREIGEYGFERQGDLASVCGDDLTVPITRVVRRLGETLAGSCLPDFAPLDLAQCDLLTDYYREGCEPGLDEITYQSSPACGFPRETWSVDTTSELTLALCGHHSNPRRIVLSPGALSDIGYDLRLVCPRVPCTSDGDCARVAGGSSAYECEPTLGQCRPR